MQRVPPKHVAPERHEYIVPDKQLQGGMDVDEVTRTYQTRVIKISRLKIQGIKGTQRTAAVLTGVATDHIEQHSQAWRHHCVFERVAAGRTDRPRKYVALTETTDLEDRLDVIVESPRFAKPPGAEGLSLLVSSTTGIAGVRGLQTEVIEISCERQRGAGRGSRAIDDPEERAGNLIIKLISPFAGGFRHDRIDLPASTAANQLQSIELERDVRPCPRRHQPPGTIAHLKAAAAD